MVWHTWCGACGMAAHRNTHLLLEPLAAFMSSSARHSLMVLTLRKAASRAPVVSSQMAWLTRRSGEISTAWRRTTPAEPMRVASSRGPLRMVGWGGGWHHEWEGWHGITHPAQSSTR